MPLLRWPRRLRDAAVQAWAEGAFSRHRGLPKIKAVLTIRPVTRSDLASVPRLITRGFLGGFAMRSPQPSRSAFHFQRWGDKRRRSRVCQPIASQAFR